MYLAVLDFTMSSDCAEAGECEHNARHGLPTAGTWNETSSGEERTHKFVAELTNSEWEALKDEWSIDVKDSEPNLGILTGFGQLDAWAFNFDGMDWNLGGVTPIDYATLYVGEYQEVNS